MLNFSAVKMSLLEILFSENHLILTFESTHPLLAEILVLFWFFSFAVFMARITLRKKSPKKTQKNPANQTTKQKTPTTKPQQRKNKTDYIFSPLIPTPSKFFP